MNGLRGFVLLVCLLTVLASGKTLANSTAEELVDAALDRLNHFVIYDGAYTKIDYPNGDVAANRGVCTDVIIRSYRSLGIDLQQQVHEDIKNNFAAYPSKAIWGLSGPDSNIDHRRVPNLQAFFRRHGETLPVSNDKKDYLPGDIVTWVVGGSRPHIGIVTHRKALLSNNPLIVHNIGFGPKLNDMLFDFPITGHYRYLP